MKNVIDREFGPGSRADYERLISQVSASKNRQAEEMYEIGLTLIEAKSRLKHGMFLAFLRDERVQYSPRIAEILMSIARAKDGRELAKLGIAKAAQMLRLKTLDKRQSLAAQHRVERLSVSELRALIDELLGKRRSTTNKDAGKAAGESTSDSSLPMQVAWSAGVLHLAIEEEVSPDSIKTAFRTLSHIFHSDKGRTTDDQFFRTLIKAREILLKHLKYSHLAQAA